MLTHELNGTWTLHAEAALQHSAKRVPNPCHGHVKKNSLQIVLQTGLDCRWLSVCLGGTPPPSSNPACMNETRADSIQHGVCATHCVCGISQLGRFSHLTLSCHVKPGSSPRKPYHQHSQRTGIKAELPHAIQWAEKEYQKVHRFSVVVSDASECKWKTVQIKTTRT